MELASATNASMAAAAYEEALRELGGTTNGTAARIAAKPADEKFPYGYGKLESIAAVWVSVCLVFSAGGMFWYVCEKLVSEYEIEFMNLTGRGRADGQEEKEDWTWSANFLLGKQMSNKKLGILGMGRIGRAVAKRAKGFGMEIHYHNRNQLSKELEEGAIYHPSIKDLFNQSDFLSINCPATKETNKLINKETINYLPKNPVVANAARGDIIDDEAMIEALKSKRVFALGLDVYNGEPKIHPEYLKLDNIFLLPHLGSATKRTRWDMGYRATENLENFFKSGKPKDKVN